MTYLKFSNAQGQITLNYPILLEIKLDWDFMAVLDICEIEADLKKKIEAATVTIKFFSC